MKYGIGFAYVGEELVAESFTLACAFHKSGDINDFDGGRHHAAGITHLDKLVESLVGHGYYSHIGLDCAEREIGRLSLRIG